MALEQINNGDTGAQAAGKIYNNDKQVAPLNWTTADNGATHPTVRVENDVLYQVISGQTATNVAPSLTPNIWRVLGVGLASDSEFKSKTAVKSMSPKQFFSVVGDIDTTPVTDIVSMTLPYAGFDVANQSQDTAGAGSFWSWDQSLYAHLSNIVMIKMYYKTAGAKTIRVSQASNPSIYTDTNVTVGVGVYTHVFSTPLNGANVLIAISGGGMGFTNRAGLTTGGRVENTGFVSVPTVSPGLQIYAGVIVDQINTVSDRLKKLENANVWTNTMYNSLSDQINPESSGSNYVIGTETLTINSPGIGNGVAMYRLSALNKRYMQLRVKFAADTKFYVGQASVENQIGKSFCVVDSVEKKLKIYALDSTTNVIASADIPYNIVAGREYIVRLYKLEVNTRIELIDTVTAISVQCEALTGGQWDMYKFGFISSSASPVISSFKIVAITNDRPFIMFDGDSNTQGDSVRQTDAPVYRKRFANLIGDRLAKPYLVSARSSGQITGVLARLGLIVDSLKPKYYCVTIGTNGGNTVTHLNTLYDALKQRGIELILNTVPLYDGTTAGINAQILQFVNEKKLKCIRMDLATSINSDGVTKDDTCYVLEGSIRIHLNEKGHQKVLERALVDLQNIFIEAGAY